MKKIPYAHLSSYFLPLLKSPQKVFRKLLGVHRRLYLFLQSYESYQYAVFIFVWYFICSLQVLFRVVFLSLFYLLLLANFQKYSAYNIDWLYYFSTTTGIIYTLTSLFLLVFSIGGNTLILGQYQAQKAESRAQFSAPKKSTKILLQLFRYLGLQFSLGLRVSLLSVRFALEFLLALGFSALVFAFSQLVYIPFGLAPP